MSECTGRVRVARPVRVPGRLAPARTACALWLPQRPPAGRGGARSAAWYERLPGSSTKEWNLNGTLRSARVMRQGLTGGPRRLPGEGAPW